MRSELKIYVSLIAVCLIAIGLIQFELVRESQSPDQQNVVYLPPPEFISHLSFGYNESLADSLWLRVIQNLEACGKSRISYKKFKDKYLTHAAHKLTANQPAETRAENKLIDSSIFNENPNEKICMKGWAFRVLDAVTELAPKFRMPYAVGATTLSVLTNDYMGAKIIFDKGVKEFPHDWSILYRAAYHYLYEIHDLPTAARLLNLAGDNGAPIWVKSLASRLYTRSGQLFLGLTTLKAYYGTIKNDPKLKKIVGQRIARLEAMIRKKKANQ